MKIIRGMFLSVLIVGFFCSPIFAQQPAIGNYYKQLSNKVMMDIFHALQVAKFKYPILDGFGQNNLGRNQHGIYSILFISKENEKWKRSIFEFGLTITGLQDKNFKDKGAYSFDFGFPLLGIKFAGYQIRDTRLQDFNILQYLQQSGRIFLEEQNRKMPIYLDLQLSQDQFEVGEPIEFTISVRNMTDKALLIRDFTEDSLFCIYRNTTWGKEKIDSDGLKGVQKIVVQPGESISKTFTGSAFVQPMEFDIYCLYRMTYKGVNPSITRKVKIVKPQPQLQPQPSS